MIDPEAGPLVITRWLDDGAAGAVRAALDNERRILERLQGVAGCPRLVRCDMDRLELVVADCGGVPLSQSGLLGHIDLARFLAITEGLARILAAIHARGIVHRDLNPANILIRAEALSAVPVDANPIVNQGLQIVGFDLATTFAEEHPEFDHPSHLRGTPAYLSPERTGRMNRPVDYRTDLYSLGATLYALATGAPPFADTDPLALIHAHLARSPVPPQERATWLPPRVAEVILTLLAKEPDDRYRSAAGLAHDLCLLRQAVRDGLALDQVPLKTRDLPLSPRPPRRLYGRDRELVVLLETCAQVAAGGVRGLFVAGYSGVGKTALIREVHRPVTLAQGLFLSGKFDQFQQDRPFLAPAQCLRQLCQSLLAEPEAILARRRERMLAGLGPDAGALFEVVPELEALLGPQPPVPALGPIEAQVRLRALLVVLLRQVAAPGHPLVLFLDDLQWADQPSLDFIAAMLDAPALDGLLLIGAYRDNAVDAAHPLVRLLNRLTTSGAPLSVLTLASLTLDDLDALLADMLYTPPAEVRPLTAALYAKTSGNPFFTIEFLQALYRAGALCPDLEQGRWDWVLDTVLAHPASANVADFLATGLRELPGATLDALLTAAGLGNTCTLDLLALASGTDPGDLAEHLRPALERGILFTPDALAFHRADRAAVLHFCHDRMQQAVYLLRDDAARARLHLAMARRFDQRRVRIAYPTGDCDRRQRFAQTSETDQDADPAATLRAAEHYAIAAPLIEERAEQTRARALFLKAAVQARHSGSFAMAERFLRLGIGQLAAEAWQREHEAAFALHAELHLVLYSQSRLDEADAVYALLATAAASHRCEAGELLAPICIQIASLSNRTRYGDAVTLGAGLLRELGMVLPLEHPQQSVVPEIELFYRQVAAGALEQLPLQRNMDDERLMMIAQLLNRLIPAALFSDPPLGFWMMARCSRLWIESGYSEFLSYPMCCIAMVTVALRDDYATGYRAARAALETALARDRGPEVARARHAFGLFACHWFQPLDHDLEHAQAAFAGLVRAGDLEFANFTFFTSQAALFDTCTDLAQLRTETATAIGFARKTGSTHSEQAFVPFQQLVRALESTTLGRGSFDDADFSDAAYLAATRGNAMALAYFHTYRALGACLFEDDAQWSSHAEAAVALSPQISGFYPTALATFL